MLTARQIALSALTLASIGAPGVRAATYNLTTIDVPGALDTYLGGINNLGQISGEYVDATSGTHGFVNTGAGFMAISVPGSTFTAPHGINDGGQVTGIYSTGGPEHGFIDTNGVFTTIDVPGALATDAIAINNAGQVVGFDSTSAGGASFLDTNGTFTKIAVPGAGSTTAYGINNAGQVVGSYTDQLGGGMHGFVDTNGTYTSIDVPSALIVKPSPNAIVTPNTQVFAINDAGQIAGEYSDYDGTHAFVEANGSFSVFNAPGVPSNSMNAPFIVPYAINDLGQVVGAYQDAKQNQNGFAANPTGTSVPEPASAALLAAGIAGVGLLRRRRSV